MLIFPPDNQVVTEFEKVKKLAGEHCLGEPGRLHLLELVCSAVPGEVSQRIEEVQEFKSIIENGDPFPTEGYHDILKEIRLLTVANSVLPAEALTGILFFMRGASSLFDFFIKRKESYTLFESLFSSVPFEKSIITGIEEVLEDTGQIKSSASPDLQRIRRVLSKRRIEAERLYQSIIHKYKKNGWVAGSEESMRNGRRVVSVFAEQKRTIRGIVHDISTTGKTVFIEPEETISINNDLYDLEQEEKREIYRILKALCQTLRPYSNLLKTYAGLMALCDSCRARALFAISTQSNRPMLAEQPVIDLKNARHPLLFLYNKTHQKPTIPFSIRLDKNRILVISGPNAGGKTVCMKTIGLAQLMLQSGFLVPADEGSTMGIFEKLMVDLGDSQSLEYELSTYSSRLSLMRTFLEECNSRTLFLIDEFGTGTDPNLGGALAEAVLEALHQKGPFGIITTHYLNLKLLADRTPGIINGSMAFAPEELKPLYQLIIGKPGSSYTFVVAERRGLSKSLIQSAARKIDRKSYDLEKLLGKIESDKNSLQEKLKEASGHEKKLNELIRKYGQLQAETEKIKTGFEKRITEKEARLVEDMNRLFKGFLKEWKAAKNKKQAAERFSRQLEIRYNKLFPGRPETAKPNRQLYDVALFKPGQSVKLNGGRTAGTIESIDGKKARVLFGGFHTICKLEDLVPVEEKK